MQSMERPFTSLSLERDSIAGSGPRLIAWETRSQAASGEQEAWILTYLDMLTLLLTLFVLLLAYSSLRPEKYQHLTQAMDKTSVTQPSTGQSDTAAAPPLPLEQVPAAARFMEAISAKKLDDRVKLIPEQDKVSLEIRDNILFASGSADLTATGRTLLEQLAPILQESNFFVSVEGHTDNLPIATDRFPSNWDLSAGRAASVVRYLVERGLVADRLRAIGRADTLPVADNDTDQGRARNRRVVLLMHVQEE